MYRTPRDPRQQTSQLSFQWGQTAPQPSGSQANNEFPTPKEAEEIQKELAASYRQSREDQKKAKLENPGVGASPALEAAGSSEARAPVKRVLSPGGAETSKTNSENMGKKNGGGKGKSGKGKMGKTSERRLEAGRPATPPKAVPVTQNQDQKTDQQC